jgi:hypothetical protein
MPKEEKKAHAREKLREFKTAPPEEPADRFIGFRVAPPDEPNLSKRQEKKESK